MNRNQKQKQKQKRAATVFIVAFFVFFLFSSAAFATAGGSAPATRSPVVSRAPSVVISCPEGKICLDNPISANSVPELVNLILKGLFGIVGTVALVIFMYGGFTWMTAQGQEKKIKQGWDTLTWGALGLTLIFGSYIIVQFLLGILLKPTTGSGGGGAADTAESGTGVDDSSGGTGVGE